MSDADVMAWVRTLHAEGQSPGAIARMSEGELSRAEVLAILGNAQRTSARLDADIRVRITPAVEADIEADAAALKLSKSDYARRALDLAFQARHGRLPGQPASEGVVLRVPPFRAGDR